MSSWHSYPKIYNIGHRAIARLFDNPVVIEEKVDGSQISFGLIDGELRVRSKGKEQLPDTDKMFVPAVEEIRSLDLVPGWTYSGEYLKQPKHNTLVYGRVPAHHIVLFDIRVAEECYLSPSDKAADAARLGLEVVPQLECPTPDVDSLKALLGRESFLGGTKIEGIVVKNYDRFSTDGKVLMGKFVSEAFKERNDRDWKKRHPNRGDLVEGLGAQLCTEARWRKAVQRLRDDGLIQDDPSDIGPLLKQIQNDVWEEEADWIAEQLQKHFRRQILKRCVAGFPQWYKEQLMKGAFECPTKSTS